MGDRDEPPEHSWTKEYDQGFKDGGNDIEADYSSVLGEIQDFEWPADKGFSPSEVAAVIAELAAELRASYRGLRPMKLTSVVITCEKCGEQREFPIMRDRTGMGISAWHSCRLASLQGTSAPLPSPLPENVTFVAFDPPQAPFTIITGKMEHCARHGDWVSGPVQCPQCVAYSHPPAPPIPTSAPIPRDWG